MERYDSIIRTYGKEGFEKIQNAKVLVVGGGGIGCEILKNLALTGFKTIELIDLDTIDVSNLNRQFLFRPEHVGQSKALVAGKAATSFNPDMKVISYHDNIKNTKFNLSYFEKFDLVLNALDNIEARRHVNRLCLAANVPLIDSGTTGYLGQVMPILKNKTSCYECFPKPTQKVYPICTIRSTPDKPVHCIVWAKECFKLLFNQPSESMLYEDTSTGETSTYMHLITFPDVTSNTTSTGSSNGSTNSIDTILEYGKNLLIALYNTEIQKRLEMDVYKTAKVIPVPLNITAITTAVEECHQILTNSNAKTSNNLTSAGWVNRIFTLNENLIQFLLCLYDISISNEKNLIGTLSFDKDDLWAMKFITVASNLRSHVFTIPLLSFHDAKGVAGNIIPAIATTNAIVAGVQVLQAVRLLTKPGALLAAEGETTEQHQRRVQLLCPHTYCLRLPTRRGLFLQPCQAEGPLPACYVCGGSEVTLQIDIHASTLDDVVTQVLKGKLGFNEPSVMLGSNFLYEEGDGADEDLQENLPKKLALCPAGGVQDGAQLVIEDFTQNLEVRLVVKHVSQEVLGAIPSAAEDMFVIGGQGAFEKLQQQQQEKEQQEKAKQGSATSTSTTATAEDDGFVVLDDVEVVVTTSTATAATASGTASNSTTSNGIRKRDIADMSEADNSDITSNTTKKQRED